MLIRIRRLAGSVIGAGFILLLSLSMLQLGEVVNPLSFFRGDPVVIKVGDEIQRWNTLNTNQTLANSFGLSAPAYAAQGYGPLITSMSIKDSWGNQNLLMAENSQIGLRNFITQQNAFFTQDSFSSSLEKLAPMANIVPAISWSTENANHLLPAFLQPLPGKQVRQQYDFDVINLFHDIESIALPDDEILQTYIRENQGFYQRPPTWNLDALIIEKSTLAERIDVTDDQIRQFYNDNKGAFTLPETWDYQTITFLTILEANLFKAQIDQGVDYETAVKGSTGQLDNPGPQERSAFSSEILEQLNPDNVGILKGPDEQADGTLTFSYLKAHVPEKVISLDDGFDRARELLQLDLAGNQLSETILDLQRRARQDELTLVEIAEEEGFTIEQFEGLQTADSAPVPLKSPAFFDRLSRITNPQTLASRFELEPGIREMLFTVTTYEPQRPKTFEEAQTEAREAWIQEQAQNATTLRANNLAESLRSGTSLQDALAALDDPSVTTERFNQVSRLSLSDEENADFSFLRALDQAAQDRFSGAPSGPLEANILNFNPRITSPLYLNDRDVMIVDRGIGQRLVFAHKGMEQDTTDVRETLIDTLVDTSTASLFSEALLLTYLNDVSASRPATIEQAAIDSQVLAQQRAAAQHARGI